MEESARNLRALTILSTALTIPFRVPEPDSVGVLVVTKDIWSLRLGWSELLLSSDAVRARGALTEMNLLGLDKAVALRLAHDPWVDELGEEYYDRRLFGSRWALWESLDVLFDDESGTSLRGLYALIYPFWSLDTRWGGQLSFQHDSGTTRAQRGSELAKVHLEGLDPLDYRYRRDLWELDAALAYQWGASVKQRLTLQLEASDSRYEPDASVPAGRRDEFLRAVRRRPEFTNQVLLGWSLRGTDYEKQRDVNTYSLTEDFRTGLELQASVGLSHRALGSDRDYVSLFGLAGYRWVGARGTMLAASVEGGGRRGHDGVFDRRLESRLEIVGPASPWGRVVWKSVASQVWDNRTLGLQAVGGDGGLRGHPIGVLRGDSAWLSNLELRSRSWHWRTYQVGGVAFWDVGSAWDEGARPPLRHGVGLGFRVLLPQVNRRLLRLDLAAPPDRLLAARLVFAFDQAF